MALAVSIKFTFADGNNKPSSTRIYVPTGFSISQYVEFAQGAAQILTNASLCSITGATLCVGLDISAATIKAVPLLASDVWGKVKLIYSSAVAGFRRTFNLPAADSAKFALNSDDVNQGGAEFIALDGAITNGIAVTGGTIAPVTVRDQDLTAVTVATKLFLGE